MVTIGWVGGEREDNFFKEGTMVVARGWRENWCFMGRVLVYKMKGFWRRMVVMITQ